MLVKKKQELIEEEETDFDSLIEKYFKQFSVVENEEEVNARIEKEAMRKFEKIKNDQQKRLTSIRNEIEGSMIKAALVDKNQEKVEKVIEVF